VRSGDLGTQRIESPARPQRNAAAWPRATFPVLLAAGEKIFFSRNPQFPCRAVASAGCRRRTIFSAIRLLRDS
jgi:hypothetical protein